MTANAKKIIDDDNKCKNQEEVLKIENYQRLHWDVFYKNNTTNGYKDRHYIRHEFTNLVDAISDGKGLTEKDAKSDQDDDDSDV